MPRLKTCSPYMLLRQTCTTTIDRTPRSTASPHHSRPSSQVMGTGARAALVLDFVAYICSEKLRAERSVGAFSSSSSLALPRFVTNTLPAEHTPARINIKTALSRHDDTGMHGRIFNLHGTSPDYPPASTLNGQLRIVCSSLAYLAMRLTPCASQSVRCASASKQPYYATYRTYVPFGYLKCLETLGRPLFGLCSRAG